MQSLQGKLVFTSEKLWCAFSTKESYQSEHLSKVVYKFVCASCNASYVGQTCQYLTTRIDEDFGKDKKSHIYQQLMPSTDCLGKCSKDCFSVLDTTNTKYQLRIKEYLYITWLKPILNKQTTLLIHHVTFFLSSFSFVLFPISFDYIVWWKCKFRIFTVFIIF